MSIQSNINQMLSIAGLLFTQNPVIKAKAEERAKAATLTKEEKVFRKRLETSAPMSDEELAAVEGLADVARKQYELNPSEKTLAGKEAAEEAVINPSLYDPGFEYRGELRTALTKSLEKQAKAQQELNAAQEERRNGKIASNIANLPTSFNMTVGELGPAAQSYIEQEYRKENTNG